MGNTDYPVENVGGAHWLAEESLLVLRTLGIQTQTLSSSYLLPSTVRFIPTSQIRDIFIHEAFRGFEVKFYLAIVVEGESEVVVVFPVRSQVLSSDVPADTPAASSTAQKSLGGGLARRKGMSI